MSLRVHPAIEIRRPFSNRAAVLLAFLLLIGSAADGYFRARSLPYAAYRGATVVMPGKRYPGLKLRGANLRGAQLRGSDLTRAQLRGTTFSGACLAEARLGAADLRGAGLFMADLTAADLVAADLRGASLRGAHLFGADLTGARLEGADLTSACYDENTLWPEGFDPRARGAFVLPEPPPLPPVETQSE